MVSAAYSMIIKKKADETSSNKKNYAAHQSYFIFLS